VLGWVVTKTEQGNCWKRDWGGRGGCGCRLRSVCALKEQNIRQKITKKWNEGGDEIPKVYIGLNRMKNN